MTPITILFVLLGLSRILGSADGGETRDEGEADPIILWWDRPGTRPDYVATCHSGHSCLVTVNNSLFHTQDIMMYLFSGSGFLSTGLPFPRRDGDLWALIHEESPKNNDWLFSFESTMELFNYTSTYKRESDFPMPTHWLASEKVLTSKEYFLSTAEKNRIRKEEGIAPILFVHSDCTTSSKREQYLKLLQQYVDVDSYGSCLQNKDFPKEYRHLQGMSGYTHPDYIKFVARYKFAMAIENAICDDYVTEKFWRPLHAGTVPIALGSPKLRDFFPAKKSVIMIQDFTTVKALAHYIKYLDANDGLYDEYREFKDTGISNTALLQQLARGTPSGRDAQSYLTYANMFTCFLCNRLHAAKRAARAGESIPRARARLDHFGCPLPTGTLDEDGQFVYDPKSERAIHYYKTNAKALRYFYDKGETISSHELYLYSQEQFKKELQARSEL